MPRSKQQNQQIKDERRRQIMDAAVKIFAEKGLSATMISDIAAACDLSYGLIYHYFPASNTESYREIMFA